MHRSDDLQLAVRPGQQVQEVTVRFLDQQGLCRVERLSLELLAAFILDNIQHPTAYPRVEEMRDIN